MGLMNLLGILETDLPLDKKVELHLSGNCYPPVPNNLVPACVLAIHLCVDGKGEEKVSLPEGTLYRGVFAEAPAEAIVENFRLEAFVDYFGGDDDG